MLRTAHRHSHRGAQVYFWERASRTAAGDIEEGTALLEKATGDDDVGFGYGTGSAPLGSHVLRPKHSHGPARDAQREARISVRATEAAQNSAHQHRPGPVERALPGIISLTRSDAWWS